MNLSKNSASDDEDDLEYLRLAALESLKKPTQIGNIGSQMNYNKKVGSFNGSAKRMRGFQGGRVPRNGQFNNRIRNSNLISIPIAPSEEELANNSNKLVLPQDRYSNVKKSEVAEEITSKFNRYNDSDKSEDESESEVESEASVESPKKLERSDSLEALMQELQNEIEGDTKPKVEEKTVKPKTKIKKVKKPKTVVEQKENVTENEVKVEKTEEIVESVVPKEIECKIEVKEKAPSPKCTERPWLPKKRSFNRNRERNVTDHLPFINQPILPPQPYFDPSIPIHHPFVPYGPPPMFPIDYRVPRFDRPLSPLTLNTDLLSTTVTAPLSPRSAAFVLENRKIIEQRKRSPRRSYSRSPSPRFRRSRSRSPVYRGLSPSYRASSPRRRSPPNNRRLSPVGRPLVNKRSSPVVQKKVSPNRTSVRERLGVKKAGDVSLSPSPERESANKLPEEKLLDPVMEARKKKFETNEIKVKEGIIRLKPTNESEVQQKEESLLGNVTEDELDIDESILDTKFDDLFEDEETDNENEGRFKVSEGQRTVKPPILPFSHLMKLTSLSIKRGTSPKLKPLLRTARKEKRAKEAIKSRLVSVEKPKPPVSTLPEKKIEIKIRNPTKYEFHAEDMKPRKEKAERKVEVAPIPEDPFEDEPEVIIDNEEDEDDNSNVTEGGDLRAQLSRKRAERQNKVALIDGVPARLLQNALESAVFKKSKKRSKEKRDTAPKDGKLPIHSRLGIAGKVELFEELPKKKRKRKTRGTVDQSDCMREVCM